MKDTILISIIAILALLLFATPKPLTTVEVVRVLDETPDDAEGFEVGTAQCIIYLDITDPELLHPGAHEVRIRGNRVVRR